MKPECNCKKWDDVPKEWTKADWRDWYQTLDKFIDRVKKRHGKTTLSE